MVSIPRLFPDAARLLAFPPTDLAFVFLAYFKQLPSQDRWHVSRCVTHWAAGYAPGEREEVARLLLAAWRSLHESGYLDDVGPNGLAADRHVAGDRVAPSAA